MDFHARTLADLRAKRSLLATKRVVAGLDGFVDTIVTPVGLRAGAGENFTPIATIPEFAQRISAAAGKSTNIELFPRLQKLGGNGPIMTGALLAAGVPVACIGAFGRGAPHPVFQPIVDRAEVVSLCDPALTTAIEFGDGKIMLGQMRTFDEITFEKIVSSVGLARLTAWLEKADLIALLNWTMIPHLTSIWTKLMAEVLPGLSVRERRFFFDLADPEKRSRHDLTEALNTLAAFQKFGRVTLGLNLKEAQQVHAALGFSATAEDESGLRAMAAKIRETLRVDTVVIHPRASAVCATSHATSWVPGSYCQAPRVETGAGDHFNAGFALGQLLGLSAEACLTLGVCTSGHYVRTACSPSLDDLETFLAKQT
jgi:hypothetical protein